jgi:hypothetical protein
MARDAAVFLLENPDKQSSDKRITLMYSNAKLSNEFDFLAKVMKSGEGICGIGAESKDKFEKKLLAFIEMCDLQKHKTRTESPKNNVTVSNIGFKPKISSSADLRDFVLKTGNHETPGKSSPIEGWTESCQGKQVQIHRYDGFVFRSDTRGPNTLPPGGFESRKSLGAPTNLKEAMGLSDSIGATGHSGVSTSKDISGAICYLGNSGGAPQSREDQGHAYLYILDTRGTQNFDLAGC